MSDLLTEVDGPIAYGTFNRPEARNALWQDMRQQMFEFLKAVDRDPAVRCVVFRGAGEHFMAGGDVKSFARIARDTSPQERREMFEEEEPQHFVGTSHDTGRPDGNMPIEAST